MIKNFPIVCIGGSAGGTEAYVEILKHLAVDTGAAIVIVNHITRTPSTLHKFLSFHTSMPVEPITSGLRLKPNHLFIVPSNCDLHVLDGTFDLQKRSKLSGWPDVITVFLRSLAQQWSGTIIAVIVSGLDADGTAALKEVKEVGGITIAQTPEDAEWSDMPESAIKTGYVDYVLSLEAIAQKISQIAAEDADTQN